MKIPSAVWLNHFQSPHAGFCPQVAAASIEAARDAYFNDHRVDSTLAAAGFVFAQLYTQGNLQVVTGTRVIEQPDGQASLVVAVVFRGTDEGLDWFYNLNADLVPFDNKRSGRSGERERTARVHQGFYALERRFESLFPEIQLETGTGKRSLQELLQQESDRNQLRFWVVGHSLGGAVGTIFLLRLLSEYQILPGRAAAYTFGAPPVGNRVLAARFGHGHTGHTIDPADRARIYRIINTEDPIPGARIGRHDLAHKERGFLPRPPYAYLGLHHIGQEYRFSPRTVSEYFKLYHELSGHSYNSWHLADVHFIKAYQVGMMKILNDVRKKNAHPE
ncbi:MAG: lipase family protein [Solirubrobacterales bacterium]